MQSGIKSGTKEMNGKKIESDEYTIIMTFYDMQILIKLVLN